MDASEFDFLTMTWGEGMASLWCWETEVRSLKMSNACRKSSIESWYTKLLGHEYNTDLNDTRKLCTGFRYIFEHSALLKIVFHMEKQQKIQKNINEYSTNLCCFHVQCSLRLTITEFNWVERNLEGPPVQLPCSDRTSRATSGWSFSCNWEQAGGVRFIVPVGLASILLSKVGWWDDGPQFKPKFCKEMNSVVIDRNSNCCFSAAIFLSSLCLLCSQLSQASLLCAVILPRRLLTTNAPTSHSLSLFDSVLSPAFCRLLVSVYFSLQFSAATCFWTLCSASPQTQSL